MPDFLLELLSEEIPARMQEKAAKDLAFLVGEELLKAGLSWGAVEHHATPRRLALIVRELPLQTDALSEEVKGPKVGAPSQALDGFLRKTGLAREQLVERNGVWFAVTDKPGRATVDVLAEAFPAVIRAFPWPKSMRWGAASTSTASLRWVRPLKGIVALFGEAIVPVEIAGIVAGATTVGHRFHHPGPITIGSAHDYAEKLRACHVILDADERKAIIRDGAAKAAAEAGLTVIADEGLVTENAGLTEWPVPLLGRFDPAFLELPREVIQLTMRTNQKYFACAGADGALAPAFVCTANIDAKDGGAGIVAGNAKVLAARLSDARFFWTQDLKVPLDEQAKKLGQIVFHEKLGTVADKVERVAKLARWLVEEGIIRSSPARGGGPSRSDGGGGAASGGSLAARPLHQPAAGPPPRSGEVLAQLAERAAHLAKADLVTGMVGEFPELQGVMGGYYARAQGEPDEVADAIRDHYKPVGQGDEVPTAPVTVAVSLADKLDTLFAFFAIGDAPTGSRDPFALRRAALGVIRLVAKSGLRLKLSTIASGTLIELTRHIALTWPDFDGHVRSITRMWYEAQKSDRPYLLTEDEVPFRVQENGINRDVISIELGEIMLSIIQLYQQLSAYPEELIDFFADRLKVQQREAGVRHDLIDAVFALGGEDDLVRLLARVRALQGFVATSEGANLLAGYKRAANILKKEGWGGVQPFPRVRGEGQVGVADQGEGDAGGGSTPPLPSAAFGGSLPLPAGGERAEAEDALVAALDAAEPRAEAAIAGEDFEGAMQALATLRAPIDAFFEQVTVNDPDQDVRARRLDLLARIRDAVHKVADFSKIEG